MVCSSSAGSVVVLMGIVIFFGIVPFLPLVEIRETPEFHDFNENG